MNRAWKASLWVGLGVLLGLTIDSVASAAPKVDYSKAARALLLSRGFEVVPSTVLSMTFRAISLVELEKDAPTAADWAATELATGHVVLVPVNLVDGKKQPYDGSGLPRNVISIPPSDAPDLLKTGLYLEYKQ